MFPYHLYAFPVYEDEESYQIPTFPTKGLKPVLQDRKIEDLESIENDFALPNESANTVSYFNAPSQSGASAFMYENLSNTTESGPSTNSNLFNLTGLSLAPKGNSSDWTEPSLPSNGNIFNYTEPKLTPNATGLCDSFAPNTEQFNFTVPAKMAPESNTSDSSQPFLPLKANDAQFKIPVSVPVRKETVVKEFTSLNTSKKVTETKFTKIESLKSSNCIREEKNKLKLPTPQDLPAVNKTLETVVTSTKVVAVDKVSVESREVVKPKDDSSTRSNTGDPTQKLMCNMELVRF